MVPFNEIDWLEVLYLFLIALVGFAIVMLPILFKYRKECSRGKGFWKFHKWENTSFRTVYIKDSGFNFRHDYCSERRCKNCNTVE